MRARNSSAVMALSLKQQALKGLALLSLAVIGAVAVLSPARAGVVFPDPSAFAGEPVQAALHGDLDGDGRLDQIVRQYDADSDRVRLVALMARANGVERIPLTAVDRADRFDWHVAAPDAFRLDCGGETGCVPQTVQTRTDSLVLSLEGGSTILMRWTGTHFEPEFIRSEAVVLTRMLGLLSPQS